MRGRAGWGEAGRGDVPGQSMNERHRSIRAGRQHVYVVCLRGRLDVGGSRGACVGLWRECDCGGVNLCEWSASQPASRPGPSVPPMLGFFVDNNA